MAPAQNVWFYAILTIVPHWLGLYLIAHHRRGTSAWWAGVALVGAGGYMFTWVLCGLAHTPSMILRISRWVAFPATVELVAAYALALSARFPHRPIPRRPLLTAAGLGGVVCLLIIPFPYLFRSPVPAADGGVSFYAGPLYPLWSTYVLGMIGAMLYQLARSAWEQPPGPAREGAWRRFAAILLLAIGGTGDNLAAYTGVADILRVTRWAYVPGLLLTAYWVSSDPGFFPRLRTLSPGLFRSAIGVGGAVGGMLVALWLGYRLEGASPARTAFILSAYWMITVVMLWQRWGKALNPVHSWQAGDWRRQLQTLVGQTEESPQAKQLDALVTALAYALDTDEVCLVQASAGEVRFLAHYNAFRASSPLTEIMVSAPDPARWPERMALESGLALPVPGPDPLWLLVDMPALEAAYRTEERTLAEEVAAQIGRLLTAPSAAARPGEVSDRQAEEGLDLYSLLRQASARRMLGQALRCLHDPASLGRTALGRLGPGRTAWERGEALQDWLRRGIEAQRPTGGQEDGVAWRRYKALHLRYVEGLSVQEVSERLYISRRQCQRELRHALESLRAWLVHTYVNDPDGTFLAQKGLTDQPAA